MHVKEKESNLVKTSVGDRYVLEEMVKDKYVLGGEQSGHVIFLDYNSTGDGLVTALQIAGIVKKRGNSFIRIMLNNERTSTSIS